ncbi:MAG: (d)CMP kinase [Anaerolineae bacterium]|nr:(d)CMP kinase [Anaerolineae bacterium]
MTLSSVIAIDGPAASGKSTVGALLAQRLEYVYFDTGVMYRAVTWAALARGTAIDDEAAVTALSEQLHIQVAVPTADDGRQYTVLADGEDVTWAIRTPQVNQNVSPVSAYPGVREALVAQQRRIAGQGRIVMVGRDIGTVVLPQADLKIYLDASVDARARRRHHELIAHRQENGIDLAQEYDEILNSMIRRDQIDSSRAASPLRPADDAIILDTTDLTVAQVLDRILALIAQAD